MAIAAVDAFAADVVEMAELNRLIDKFVLLRGERRPHQREDDPRDQAEQRHDTHEAHAGGGVGAFRKQLAHEWL